MAGLELPCKFKLINMVSVAVQNVIKDVFPDVEIEDYDEHEASVTIDVLQTEKVSELIGKTKHWSACVWEIKGCTDTGGAMIIFKHVGLSG